MFPYIFVLDLDGTIIGDVKFQIARHTLHESLRKRGVKLEAGGGKVPAAFHPSQKLIRPGFANFIKAMADTYPWTEFFVFTASEKSWALTEVPWIEKACGVQFSRPIFTRDDCVIDAGGSYKKSLTKIMPRIWRTVAKKHVLTKLERTYVMQNNVMIIDNTAVYIDNQDKLLLCPDYSYAVFEDMLSGLPPDIMEHPTILSLMNAGLVCPANPADKRDPVRALGEKYKWLAAKCQAVSDINRTFVDDAFWKLLRRLIVDNNITQFAGTVIPELQRVCWKRGAPRAR